MSCEFTLCYVHTLCLADNDIKYGAKRVVPGNFVTAGHGEQPFSLKNPVPSLDGVTGANWDGAFP